MGFVCYVRYYNSVLFDNSLFLIKVDGYKLWLVPKKIC